VAYVESGGEPLNLPSPDEHPQMFECFQPGFGQYRGPPVSLKMYPNVQPIFIKARTLPYAKRAGVARELRRMVEAGSLTPLRTSSWVTPIIPIDKGNGRYRVCGDYKVTVNKGIIMVHYPFPTLTDLFAKAARKRFFSKLDSDRAYLQLGVTEESSRIQTLNTHIGLFAVNRLNFRVASSPGIFQGFIADELADFGDNVCVLLDYVLLATESLSQLATLEVQILQRFSDLGLRLNHAKCEFRKTSVRYLGHIVTGDSLKPLAERVEALLNAPAPHDVKTLQCFLGKLNFYGRFLPSRATICAPLYDLLRNDIPWSWGESQQRAFEEACKLLCSNDVVTQFSLDRELVLSVDSSPCGTGAIMAHIMDDGYERPVTYVSRRISDRNPATVKLTGSCAVPYMP